MIVLFSILTNTMKYLPLLVIPFLAFGCEMQDPFAPEPPKPKLESTKPVVTGLKTIKGDCEYAPPDKCTKDIYWLQVSHTNSYIITKEQFEMNSIGKPPVYTNRP